MMYDYKLHLVIRTPQACLWEQSGLKVLMPEMSERLNRKTEK